MILNYRFVDFLTYRYLERGDPWVTLLLSCSRKQAVNVLVGFTRIFHRLSHFRPQQVGVALPGPLGPSCVECKSGIGFLSGFLSAAHPWAVTRPYLATATAEFKLIVLLKVCVRGPGCASVLSSAPLFVGRLRGLGCAKAA